MTPDTPPLIPLLGALLVTEGLLSQGQVEACLLLQQHDYPQLRLGEIAMRCGYLTAADLERALQLQSAMRGALIAALEASAPIAADLDVLVVLSRPVPLLTSELTRLGALVRYAGTPPADLPDERADLILIGPAQLPWCEDLPDTCVVGLLPAELDRQQDSRGMSAGLRKLLEHYVRQARAQRTTSMGPRGDSTTSHSPPTSHGADPGFAVRAIYGAPAPAE